MIPDTTDIYLTENFFLNHYNMKFNRKFPSSQIFWF